MMRSLLTTFTLCSLSCSAGAQEIPSSERSREAAARVTPALKRDLADHGIRFGAPVYIRIFKQERKLEMWLKKDNRFVLFRTYPVAAMSGTLGPKLREGDRQAPEGFYFVTPQRMNPNSRFHLSFNLGYPNVYDHAHGRTGSFLMVHGNRVSIGCFAMTDPKIEEIYTLCDAALRSGQPYFRVHCFPFHMTPANMQRHQDSCWHPFWQNLKQGYDHFETHRIPPDTTVQGQRYHFAAD